MDLPDKFIERYSKIVDNPERFFASLGNLAPKSFRVNTIKATNAEIEERFESYGIEIKKTAWYPEAYVSSNPDIGGTLEHFLGKIYIQELASMLPPLAVKEELKSANFVLDLCAAPGSKTTQISAIMDNKGLVVANDINYDRIKALKFNIEKTGSLNTMISNFDGRKFPDNQFDVVFLDAPCSSEGTMRKSFDISSRWSEKMINGHASLQKQLVLRAFDLLSPGGTMIYSTCTFAPEEDEGIVNYLVQNREAKIEKISIPNFVFDSGIVEWNEQKFDSDVKKACRVWPHHNDTEGFFLAKVTK
ncbi:NOL1/NOP2/sun family putative RNA methylase [Candidatus Micrarchaeota archaeon]|nr:NOL1/NOP2/sun family putative RNA methylase [Candidatus Micrarchaeota archaeon]